MIVTTWVLWQLTVFLVVSPAMMATTHRDNVRDTLSSLGAIKEAAGQFRSRNGHYPRGVLVSAAADRQFEQADAGWYIGRTRETFEFSSRERDIVVVDDAFVRYPEVFSAPDAAAPAPAARP